MEYRISYTDTCPGDSDDDDTVLNKKVEFTADGDEEAKARLEEFKTEERAGEFYVDDFSLERIDQREKLTKLV